MNKGEIILYQAEDGLTKIQLLVIQGTVWLNQDEMSQLFDKSRSTIAEHIQNILNDAELQQDSVRRNFRRTAKDGKDYNVLHYNLDMILAVGFRVCSPRGSQFRRWANTILKEYLIKGFAMDDERLKSVEDWDYFDEWLARIRDIRASEKRFYQKVRDIYATAVDYDKTSPQAQNFFKKVQNKMLWAVTGQTAEELIFDRSDEDKPNMGLTSFKGNRVHKSDTLTAKNYLQKNEMEELNSIVTMYLDYAENQAKNRKTITMQQWVDKLDAFLNFNEKELLTHSGKVRMEVAQKLASNRYEAFDEHRKKLELLDADKDDFHQIEAFKKKIRGKKKITKWLVFQTCTISCISLDLRKGLASSVI